MRIIIFLLLATASTAAVPVLPAGWDLTLERAAPAPADLARHSAFTDNEIPWQQLDPWTRRKVIFSRHATLVMMEAKRSGKPHDLTHWHDHDQISYVLAGEVEVVLGREIRRIGPGGTYVCAARVPHSLRVLSDEAGIVEVFAPTREDFRGAPWVGIPPQVAERAALGVNEVKALVYAWFALFDRNAPVEDFIPHLSPKVEMQFPEAAVHGLGEFRRWYAGIQAAVRTATHDVRSIEVLPAGAHARVTMVVDWRATAPNGQPLGFVVEQKWSVGRSPATGAPVIESYRVRVLSR